MEEIQETLAQIFKSVLELDENEDPRQLDRKTCKKWDSLNHVKIILAIESEFEFEMDLDDAMKLGMFSDVADYVSDKNGLTR